MKANVCGLGCSLEHGLNVTDAEQGFLLRSKVHGEQTVKPHKGQFSWGERTSEYHAHEHRTVVKTAAEAEQTYDFVVCCHKGVDQDAVAKQIAPAVDQAKTTIVIIQNGV